MTSSDRDIENTDIRGSASFFLRVESAATLLPPLIPLLGTGLVYSTGLVPYIQTCILTVCICNPSFCPFVLFPERLSIGCVDLLTRIRISHQIRTSRVTFQMMLTSPLFAHRIYCTELSPVSLGHRTSHISSSLLGTVSLPLPRCPSAMLKSSI